MNLQSDRLITWNGIFYYPFLLGLFHTFLLFSSLGLGLIWYSAMWLETFETCRCHLIPFLFWPQWIPPILTWSYLQNWFLLYFVLCATELTILIWKCKTSHPDLFRMRLWLLWGVRVLLRNLSGLLFLFSLLVEPYARGYYLCLGALSLFFLYQGQQGHWSGLNLNTFPAKEPLPSLAGLQALGFWGILTLTLSLLIIYPAFHLYSFMNAYFLPFPVYTLLLLVLTLFAVYRFKKAIE